MNCLDNLEWMSGASYGLIVGILLSMALFIPILICFRQTDRELRDER